jgi:flagellar hook-associated protein 3 FlgL
VRADVGARTNRLETVAAQRQDLQVHLEALLAKTEDLDYAEALVEFSAQEAVYKAALQAGARVIQPSLLDYLR